MFVGELLWTNCMDGTDLDKFLGTTIHSFRSHLRVHYSTVVPKRLLKAISRCLFLPLEVSKKFLRNQE